MEKINIALSAIEDNTVAIRELEKKLMKRTKCRMVFGTTTAGNISFGQVTSDGTVGVVVNFATTTNATLTFCGEEVDTNLSPIVGTLPAGTGELRLNKAVKLPTALIIGG